MISPRVLAGAAVGAALAGFAAGVLTHEPDLAPVATAARAEQPGEPLPPAAFSGAERPRVPAGILARAANARALERRAPACPAGPPEEPARCPPEQREPVEIEWHVAPRDP